MNKPTKKSIFGCQGHAFNRMFFHASKDGKFNEFTVPGGAALVQQLLSAKGLAEFKPLDATCRCEHVELQSFEDKQAKKTYYTAGRRLGFTEGNTTLAPRDADYAVIFDEGLGGLVKIFPPSLLAGNVPTLWASNKVLPDRAVFNTIAAHCFLLLDADVLRNGGAMISSKISWERSATELLWQLQNNPALSALHNAPHLLVTFAEDGAVYVKREKGMLNASLVLAHGGGEGSLREKTKGTIDETFALMTAALATQLPEIFSGTNQNPLRILPILKAAETLLASGYSLEQLKGGRFDIPEAAEAKTDKTETPFEIPCPSNQSAIDPDFWCISNNANNKRIFDIACEYILKGAQVIEGFPQLTYGALTTIDRWEIESYRNVCNLIENYVRSEAVRPLSIAVFGAPGSGKSFGVTQIAKNILPGKVEKLEFNVSQFTDNADLGAAFQKVRDITLEGKLPLVFFDEFDSDRNGAQLGWIKNFLMPMQDGKFKDATGEHPLGKCILVFAGGTSASFEEFTRPMHATDPAEQQKFKDVKAPDFISRLRGTINVLGPNQTADTDKNYILRRALLLRSLCERKLNMKKGAPAPISKNILWAMLLVPKYKHGARSMEAILDMSRIEGNVWEPVSLPFHTQLSLHVDADAFIKLVLREVILNSYVEPLATTIHAKYLEEMMARGQTNHPSVVSWDVLPEEFKESNREQARDMAAKIKLAGCEYDSGDTPFPSIEQFDDPTIQFLAQKEHDRWMAEKRRNGWIFAPVRDNAKKHHPLLVDWDKLPEVEQKKDTDAVKNIIPLLKIIGLRVYRTI